MSIHIGIQTCCKVFRISYADLLTTFPSAASNGTIFRSIHITERKFAAFWLSTFCPTREVCKHLNMSYAMFEKSKACIRELIEEDRRHNVIIETLESTYFEIQSAKTGQKRAS
jgi:hypothetical protein